jgi:hypothetical protein
MTAAITSPTPARRPDLNELSRFIIFFELRFFTPLLCQRWFCNRKAGKRLLAVWLSLIAYWRKAVELFASYRICDALTRSPGSGKFSNCLAHLDVPKEKPGVLSSVGFVASNLFYAGGGVGVGGV